MVTVTSSEDVALGRQDQRVVPARRYIVNWLSNEVLDQHRLQYVLTCSESELSVSTIPETVQVASG
jgi:hypothetical protein